VRCGSLRAAKASTRWRTCCRSRRTGFAFSSSATTRVHLSVSVINAHTTERNRKSCRQRRWLRCGSGCSRRPTTVDRAEDPRAQVGARPSRLGCACRDRLVDPAAGGRAGSLAPKKTAAHVANERRKHPGTKVEIWATDENRIGLKPEADHGTACGRRSAPLRSGIIASSGCM
jgi:hypothetical protein